MKKEDKAIIINQIAETIKSYSGFYLVETAGLNAEKTSELRRACFNADIKLMVVKNTLLHKALESLDGDYSELYPEQERTYRRRHGSSPVAHAERHVGPQRRFQASQPPRRCG